MLKFLKTLFDVRYMMLFFIPAALLLILDHPMAITVGTALLVATVIVGATHFFRKVLFPYVDLAVYINKAAESPTGAGMVVVGVAFVIGQLLLAISTWMN
jgi:hypothetical protein